MSEGRRLVLEPMDIDEQIKFVQGQEELREAEAPMPTPTPGHLSVQAMVRM